MTLALLTFGSIAAIVLAWVLARLLRAQRLGRAGFDVDSEDRRLRDDPRFAEAWVRQLRSDPPQPGDERSEPMEKRQE